jgi:hypothetical protein
MKHAALACVAAFLLQPGTAASQPFSTYVEQRENPRRSRLYERYQEQRSRNTPESMILGSARQDYERFSNRFEIPGFMSSTPQPEIGRLVGPQNPTASFRIGDTIFVQWNGTPGPREGDRYAVYTPAVVLQSLRDPTDFIVRLRPERPTDFPDSFRLAGHFYESNGRIRVTKVSQGLVEAVIEALSGSMTIGDQLMPVIPVKDGITPATGGIQISAAVVAGSPVERLSTTKRSFIYINRGSRDGIREGRIFQAVDILPLDSAVGGMAPEVSVGEAMVVHVSDSYSTAMITRQFDVIRIGSLLKTKQQGGEISSREPFRNLVPTSSQTPSQPVNLEEIPNLGDLNFEEDATLPDPLRKQPPQPAPPSLSELDALEQSQKFNSLSPEERARLGRLSRQQRIGADAQGDGYADLEDPDLAPLNNSFRKGAPRRTDQKRRSNRPTDEEELNLLMMQN